MRPDGALLVLFVMALCFSFLIGVDLFLGLDGLQGGGAWPWVGGLLGLAAFAGVAVGARNTLKRELSRDGDD